MVILATLQLQYKVVALRRQKTTTRARPAGDLMKSLVNWFTSYRWYIAGFILGFLCALPYGIEEVHNALEVVGMLMLVALFASLLVPFAAFSHEERHYKWWLQNAPLLAFGAYANEVVQQPTLVKIVLMAAAMGMHIGYWNSGIHSRAFRLDQLRHSGLATKFPEEMEQIARLNANGRSGEADEIVKRLLEIK